MTWIKGRDSVNAQTGAAAVSSRPTTMFRHRQGLRRWAAYVLLLWLLGIGIGVVNACVTPDRLSAGGAVAGHPAGASLPFDSSKDIQAPRLLAAGPDCHHGASGDDGAAPARTNCADFCDQAGVSIPSLKWPHGALQGPMLFAPTAPVLTPTPAHGPAPLRVSRRDGALPLPISIAFLRLQL